MLFYRRLCKPSTQLRTEFQLYFNRVFKKVKAPDFLCDNSRQERFGVEGITFPTNFAPLIGKSYRSRRKFRREELVLITTNRTVSTSNYLSSSSERVTDEKNLFLFELQLRMLLMEKVGFDSEFVRFSDSFSASLKQIVYSIQSLSSPMITLGISFVDFLVLVVDVLAIS